MFGLGYIVFGVNSYGPMVRDQFINISLNQLWLALPGSHIGHFSGMVMGVFFAL